MTTSNFEVKKYPIDLTAQLETHLIKDEVHDLDSTDFPFIVLDVGSFYDRDLVLTLTTLTETRKLKFGIDYLFDCLNLEASKLAGKSVYDAISFKKGTVGKLKCDYRIIGEPFTNRRNEILELYSKWLGDERPVDWNKLTNKPSEFPGLDHTHTAWDVKDWGTIIIALRDEISLLKAMLVGVYNNKVQLKYIRTCIETLERKIYTLTTANEQLTTTVDSIGSDIETLKAEIAIISKAIDDGHGFTEETIPNLKGDNQYVITIKNPNDWSNVFKLVSGTIFKITMTAGNIETTLRELSNTKMTDGRIDNVDFVNAIDYDINGYAQVEYFDSKDKRTITVQSNDIDGKTYIIEVSRIGARYSAVNRTTDINARKITFKKGIVDEVTGSGYFLSKTPLKSNPIQIYYNKALTIPQLTSLIDNVNKIYELPVGSYITMTASVALYSGINIVETVQFGGACLLLYKSTDETHLTSSETGKTVIIKHTVAGSSTNGKVISVSSVTCSETPISATTPSVTIKGDWKFDGGFVDTSTGLGSVRNTSVVVKDTDTNEIFKSAIANQKINTLVTIKITKPRLTDGSLFTIIPEPMYAAGTFYLYKTAASDEIVIYKLYNTKGVLAEGFSSYNGNILNDQYINWLIPKTGHRETVWLNLNRETATRTSNKKSNTNVTSLEFNNTMGVLNYVYPLLECRSANTNQKSVITIRFTGGYRKNENGVAVGKYHTTTYIAGITNDTDPVMMQGYYTGDEGEQLVDVGYTITRSSDTVVVGFYIKPTKSYVFGTVEVFDNSNSTLTFNLASDSTLTFVTEPTGVIYAPLQRTLSSNYKTLKTGTSKVIYNADIAGYLKNSEKIYVSNPDKGVFPAIEPGTLENYYLKPLFKGYAVNPNDSLNRVGYYLAIQDTGVSFDINVGYNSLASFSPKWYKLLSENTLNNTALTFNKITTFNGGLAVTGNVDITGNITTNSKAVVTIGDYGIGAVNLPDLKSFSLLTNGSGFYRAYGAKSTKPTPSAPPDSTDQPMTVKVASTLGNTTHYHVIEGSGKNTKAWVGTVSSTTNTIQWLRLAASTEINDIVADYVSKNTSAYTVELCKTITTTVNGFEVSLIPDAPIADGRKTFRYLNSKRDGNAEYFSGYYGSDTGVIDNYANNSIDNTGVLGKEVVQEYYNLETGIRYYNRGFAYNGGSTTSGQTSWQIRQNDNPLERVSPLSIGAALDLSGQAATLRGVDYIGAMDTSYSTVPVVNYKRIATSYLDEGDYSLVGNQLTLTITPSFYKKYLKRLGFNSRLNLGNITGAMYTVIKFPINATGTTFESFSVVGVPNIGFPYNGDMRIGSSLCSLRISSIDTLVASQINEYVIRMQYNGTTSSNEYWSAFNMIDAIAIDSTASVSAYNVYAPDGERALYDTRTVSLKNDITITNTNNVVLACSGHVDRVGPYTYSLRKLTNSGASRYGIVYHTVTLYGNKSGCSVVYSASNISSYDAITIQELPRISSGNIFLRHPECSYYTQYSTTNEKQQAYSGLGSGVGMSTCGPRYSVYKPDGTLLYYKDLFTSDTNQTVTLKIPVLYLRTERKPISQNQLFLGYYKDTTTPPKSTLFGIGTNIDTSSYVKGDVVLDPVSIKGTSYMFTLGGFPVGTNYSSNIVTKDLIPYISSLANYHQTRSLLYIKVKAKRSGFSLTTSIVVDSTVKLNDTRSAKGTTVIAVDDGYYQSEVLLNIKHDEWRDGKITNTLTGLVDGDDVIITVDDGVQVYTVEGKASV